MTVALLFLLLAALGSGSQLAYKVDGRVVWMVKPSGTTVVETHLNKVALTVSIHTWQTRSDAGVPANLNRYPECKGAPCSLTDRVRVHLGGKALWVGPYQIAGLGDVHYLAVSGSPARLDLILIGGDAAASYEAHLVFNSQHVVERVLYAGIDLQHPFEVTHFYYGTIN